MSMIDPAIVGKELAQFTFPVDRSKLAELSRAFDVEDPVWWDRAAAQAAGFEGIPTPPTVTVLADHWREGGVAGLVDAVGADLARVLHGEVAWEYLVPIRGGDELTARQVVSDVTTREGGRGGAMTLIKIDTEFTNQRGELAARRTDTLIEREIRA
jgi:N-terminal half of MaoC dehydratase